jgi:predicted MFS family arabinose efflux permease
MSLGLLLGGAVTDLGSWRWTLFINIPIGIAVLSLTRRVLDETPLRPGRFDLVGALAATFGSVSLVWALIGAPEHGWGSTHTVGGFALGAMLLLGLAVTETRVAHPMIQPALLRDRRRLSGLAIIALVVGGQMSMFFLAVQYLEGQLGFGPLTTGLAFLPLTLGIFTMSRVTPRLLARLGGTPMFVIGTIGLAISFAWLSQVSAGDSYLNGAFGPMLLNGLSAGFVFMPATSSVLSGVAPEHAGSASGLLQTFQQLGGAIGLAVIVSVYAAGAQPGQFLPGADHAFQTSALFALTALAVAVIGSARLRRRPVTEPCPEPCADQQRDLVEAA